MTGSLRLRDYPGDMERYPATVPGPNRRATEASALVPARYRRREL